MNYEWVACDDRLPELGDYSVLVFWEHGGMDMVHVKDYFSDITAGCDSDGNQQYTKWYLSSGVTHWHTMPEPPKTTHKQRG